MNKPLQRAFFALVCAGLSAACRQVAPAFGSDAVAAKQNADEFFYSVSSRFTSIQRTPKLLHARQQFGHQALVPSGIFNDTSVWMSMGSDGDSTRLFSDDGYMTGDRYVVVPHSSTDPPRNLAESREVVKLRRLSGDEFEWFTNVDVAVGHVGAAEMMNVLDAALSAGRNGHRRQRVRITGLAFRARLRR